MFEKMTSAERFFFLLLFTKEMIIHSKAPWLIELERKLRLAREAEENKKVFVRRRSSPSVKRRARNDFMRSAPSGFMPSIGNMPSSESFVQGYSEVAPVRSEPKPILRRAPIPDVMLPNRFSYLRPVPTNEVLRLGKLQPFITNPRVREIECDGPDSEVVVRGPGVDPSTNISLTNEEIKLVFSDFSRVANIPIEEEVVKVAAGGWILNGVNSNVIGSRFIMRRIPQNFRFR
jgi:hypothetical protein